MNKTFKKLLFSMLICLSFGLFGALFHVITLSANDINGTENYQDTIIVNDYSYYIQLASVDYSLIPYSIGGGTYDINVKIDNIIYDRLIIVNSENLGGIEISFYNSLSNDFYYLLRYYGNIEYINKNKFNLYYNDTPFIIDTDYPFNLFMYLSNKISGYYTFNTTLIPYSVLPQGNTYENRYDIYASMVYQTETNYYLINGINVFYNQGAIMYYMYSPSGDITFIDIGNQFENDYERYIYFDSQFIDNVLYEWLKMNGVFEFSYGGLGYGQNFWDLVNAYVNIPINIISSILDISIFNTGITILVVFSSIIAIFIAFKIVRLINWSQYDQ